MAAGEDGRPTLRVITGPTAAGKSALALALAERHGALLLSADSRQVYRGFDIGTAKPSAAEQARVPHRGIDVAEPTERYSASRWAEAAGQWVAEAGAAGRTPLLVGGTGFYLRALFAPLFAEPELEPVQRAALQRELDAMSTETLRRWCRTLDPARAHLGRAQLLRALEVALLTGRRISELHAAHARPARYRARYLLVDPGAVLRERIAGRARGMMEGGWEDEVRRLAAAVAPDAPAWNATGYRAIRALTEGTAGREEALGRVVTDTRQYAKRQRTWFRHQLAREEVTRVSPDDPRAAEIVEAWWHGEGGGEA